MNIHRLLTVLIATPVAIYFYFVFKYSVNIPKLDDFGAILMSVKSLCDAKSGFQFWQNLTTFHNEHRIAYGRLVSYLLSVWANGPINIKTTIIIGNLSLVCLLAVFFQAFRRTAQPLICFLPISFLLFQFQYHENTFWGMAALQNLTVWFWAGLSLLFLTSRRLFALNTNFVNRAIIFGGALLTALAATLTSGSGLLILPIGLFVLLLQPNPRYMLVWGAVTIVVIHWYLTGLPSSANMPSSIFRKIWSTVSLLGAYVSFGSVSVTRPFLFGSCLLLTGLLSMYSNRASLTIGLFFKTNRNTPNYSFLFFLSFFAFAFLSAVAVSLSRDTVLNVSRYQIISAMSIISLYSLFLTTSQISRYRIPISLVTGLVAIVVCGISYKRLLPIVIQNRDWQVADMHRFQNKQRLKTPLYKNASGIDFDNQWRTAISWGLYKLPTCSNPARTGSKEAVIWR